MRIRLNAGALPESKNPLAKILTLMVSVLIVGATLMFSLMLFAILAVVAATVGAYFWWKTRAVRALWREQVKAAENQWQDAAYSRDSEASDGRILEGEATVVSESDEAARSARK